MDSLLASCSLPTQFYRSNVTTSCATAISSIGEITLEPYVLKSPIMFSGLKLCSNLDEQQGRMSDTRSPRPGNASLDIEDTDSIEQIDKSLKQITGKSCHLLVDTKSTFRVGTILKFGRFCAKWRGWRCGCTHCIGSTGMAPQMIPPRILSIMYDR